MTQTTVGETVLATVSDLARRYYGVSAIDAEDSLVDDLGFESMTFVDLTLLLETKLGIEAFPIQAWSDQQATRQTGKRFTIQSLIDACTVALDEP